jgi:hypothetical protein
MFKCRPRLVVFVEPMLAVCLALIAACGGNAGKSQASVPAPPTDLSATAGNAVVALRWTASSSATAYNVKRSTTSGGPYTELAAPTSTGYTDAAAANGTAYYYVVTALDATGESANSAQVSATPEAPSVVPAAPTNLTVIAGNAQASLTWSASSGASSYNVSIASTTSGGPLHAGRHPDRPPPIPTPRSRMGPPTTTSSPPSTRPARARTRRKSARLRQSRCQFHRRPQAYWPRRVTAR